MAEKFFLCLVNGILGLADIVVVMTIIGLIYWIFLSLSKEILMSIPIMEKWCYISNKSKNFIFGLLSFLLATSLILVVLFVVLKLGCWFGGVECDYFFCIN